MFKKDEVSKVAETLADAMLEVVEEERMKAAEKYGLSPNATWEEIKVAQKRDIKESVDRIADVFIPLDERLGTGFASSFRFMYQQLTVFSEHIGDKPADLAASTAANRYLNELVKLDKEFRRFSFLGKDFEALVNGLFEMAEPYLLEQNRINDSGYPTTMEELRERFC